MRDFFTRSPLLVLMLLAGYGFLYLPIISLIVYSFNESRLVTVWGGFSTKWYGELMSNGPLLDAAALSLKIAAINATLAVILGTLAALALVRFRKSRGHRSLGVMVAAPLVMPEIIIGLSLLLLFVALENLTGWPQGRGQTTILIAHATFSMKWTQRLTAPEEAAPGASASGSGPSRCSRAVARTRRRLRPATRRMAM